jgi:hypothetical protein
MRGVVILKRTVKFTWRISHSTVCTIDVDR